MTMKFETLKNKICNNKKVVTIACAGVGVSIGLVFGYVKWGRIPTMADPWTGATILTKRHLTPDECYKLSEIVMKNGHNVAKGLSDMGMLYGGNERRIIND